MSPTPLHRPPDCRPAGAAERPGRSQPPRLAAAAAHPERSESARAGHARHARPRASRTRSIAWSTQFERIRGDLDDALRGRRRWPWRAGRPSSAQYLAGIRSRSSGTPSDRIFALARARAARRKRARRSGCRCRRGRRRSAPRSRGCSSQNNESEEQTAQQVAGHLRPGAAPGLLVPGRDAGRDRRDRPVPDSRRTGGSSPSSRRSRTSGASWRSS